MKVLALAAVCFVAITTTHGFAIGIPHIGIPPFGIHPFGHGVPPLGLGISPIAHGLSLGVGSGFVQPRVKSVDNGHGYDYIGDLDAQRTAAAAAAAAAPTTGGVSAPAPLGTAYVPAYRGF